MLEINLLPERLKKKSKKQFDFLQLPNELIIGLVVGIVGLLVSIHILLLAITITANLRLKALEGNWKKIEPSKKIVDNLKQEIDSLEAKINSITSIRARKNISWSRNLNLISGDMVRGLWLTRIYYAGGALSIEGSAVSKKGEEMINVGKFASNLKGDKSFYSLLKNLELTSIQRRNIKSIEVVDFVISAGVKE